MRSRLTSLEWLPTHIVPLLEACSWSKGDVEERSKELIKVASAVLLNNQGVDPETRLKALGFTVERLLPELPIWELEDGAARPAFVGHG